MKKLGAKALVGSVQDETFIKNAFHEAEVVYTMIPPIWQTTDWLKSMREVGEKYAKAIKENKVQYVVNLSSVGADVGTGVGPVDGLSSFEKLLNAIPGLNVKHLRPSYFFTNFLTQIGLIKQSGIMGGNFGEGEKLFLVHPKDIAAATASSEKVNINFLINARFFQFKCRYNFPKITGTL